METVCRDSAFGEMRYQHRWYKEEALSMFGREWRITVTAKAFQGREINDAQRQAYRAFCIDKAHQVKIAEDALKDYVNENISLLSSTWEGAEKIQKTEALSGIATPTTLLFDRDGGTVLLLDCAWDTENGVAVALSPRIEVGPQDLFL